MWDVYTHFMNGTKSLVKSLYEQARKESEIYRFKQPIRKLDNVYDELCSYDNLECAFEKAKRGKSTKAYVIEFEEKLTVSGHAIGESNYHIAPTPAYRKIIFISLTVHELTISYIKMKLDKLRVQLLSSEYGPDHLHLLVTNVRHVSEIKLVTQIKGFSSYMMHKKYMYLFVDKLLVHKFWTYRHFYRSVEKVNKETIKKYIEETQDKHWQEI